MSTKYLSTMGDRMYCAEKKRKTACRGLFIKPYEPKPYTEPGLYLVAGLGTALLTIALFAVWYMAG
ncbi:MAG: hypothetical protein IKZ17_01355 [Bacteroidaceae bacterium]|nr:hypothetical protein [Bacteroidaceae bacterium]